jgi:hypothetical protein
VDSQTPDRFGLCGGQRDELGLTPQHVMEDTTCTELDFRLIDQARVWAVWAPHSTRPLRGLFARELLPAHSTDLHKDTHDGLTRGKALGNTYRHLPVFSRSRRSIHVTLVVG